MANVFVILDGRLIEEVTQNGVCFLTAPTPPENDNSTKIATTEWIKENVSSSTAIKAVSQNFTIDMNARKIYLNESGGTWLVDGSVMKTETTRRLNASGSWVSCAGGAQIFPSGTEFKDGSRFAPTGTFINAAAFRIA